MIDKDDPLNSSEFSRRPLMGSPDRLDADTREKWMQMRHRDLESSLENKSPFPDWLSMPLIGLITAVIFMALIYLKPNATTDNSLQELEILLSQDSIEFYEKLEFLQQWRSLNSESEEKGE